MDSLFVFNSTLKMLSFGWMEDDFFFKRVYVFSMFQP